MTPNYEGWANAQALLLDKITAATLADNPDEILRLLSMRNQIASDHGLTIIYTGQQSNKEH